LPTVKTEEADGCTGAIVKGFDGKSGVVVGVRLVGPAVVAGFVDKDVGSSAVTATDAATAEADAFTLCPLLRRLLLNGFVAKDVGSSAVTATAAATAEADAACAEVSVIDDIGAAAGSDADADVGSEHSAPSPGAS
jgi:hypothetical protein